MDLKKYIADVANFPKEGILFRDITPLMADGKAYQYACDLIYEFAVKQNADIIVGPEARGFIFGCPVATKMGVGFVPIRKPGKLPRATVEESYSLEYGQNVLSIHADAITKGQRVLIVDDLLATGGTVKAGINLVEKLGGVVVGVACLIELVDLKGRDQLKGYNVFTLMEYEGE